MRKPPRGWDRMEWPFMSAVLSSETEAPSLYLRRGVKRHMGGDGLGTSGKG